MDVLAIFFCFAITLHHIEEAIWLPKWSRHFSKFRRPVTSNEFFFAVIFITILAYLSAFSFLCRPTSDIAKWIFIGFLGSMIFNVIFPHFIAAILMRTYAPGLLTGLLLILPVNSVIICQMLLKKFIIWQELVISTLAVGIILLALIPILFKIGGKITPTG